MPGRTTGILLRVGFWIPLVFLSTTVVSGITLGDHNHLSRMVGELGALGTPSRFRFSAALIVCAATSVLFIVGRCRACTVLGIDRLPALLLRLRPLERIDCRPPAL